MNRTLTEIIILLASLLFGACSAIYDDHMYGPDGEQKVRISFVLALGSSDDSPLTKAETWSPDAPNGITGYGPDKAIGNRYDNTILLENLQIVFYTAENNYYTKVNIDSWKNVDEDGNEVDGSQTSNLYQFTGHAWIDEEYVLDNTKKLKMMVFANIGTEIDFTTDIESLTYEYDSAYIPMWGVKTVSVDDLTSTDPGAERPVIYVLRSMAKVEVVLSSALSDEGFTLTDITMNNLNRYGYCLPHYDSAPSDTEELPLEGSFKPAESLLSEYSVTGDAGSLVMYVPEYDNSSSPATINVTLKHNDDGVIASISPKQAIEFKVYDGSGQPTGDRYDIYRNHNYRFVITGINVEGGLRYHLVKIEDLELGGRYGFEF